MQDGLSNSSTNGLASSQKRQPPKLRSPKLSKRTAPSDRQSQGGQQRQSEGSERSESISLSESPNGISTASSDRQSQGSQQRQSEGSERSESISLSESPNGITKDQRQPEKPQMHSQTKTRRESGPSAEPDRVEVMEREQRRNSPEAKKRETRVQRMLRPEVKNNEIVPAQDHPAGQPGDALQNGTNPRTGQVIETTEAVTNKKKSNDQLKLRLDLNLDIEIELKAKIRGDLTLQLLQ